MQANPLPTTLQDNPSLMNRLLKIIQPGDMIDALITFQDLHRLKEKSYLSRAVFFAIAARVRNRIRSNVFSNYGIDLIHDITLDLYEIASDSDHKDHESLRSYFYRTMKLRTINAIKKHRRKNTIMDELDDLVPNPLDPNAFIRFSTGPDAELLLVMQDVKKLMSPSVRKAYENYLNGEEDDDSIGERSRYRNRAKAQKIVRGEFDQSFVTAFDDDDLLFTENLPDPREFCLTAFHFACPDHPTETDVTRWCEAFPQYAETILEEAEIARTLPTEDEGPDLTSDDIARLLPALNKLLGY